MTRILRLHYRSTCRWKELPFDSTKYYFSLKTGTASPKRQQYNLQITVPSSRKRIHCSTESPWKPEIFYNHFLYSSSFANLDHSGLSLKVDNLLRKIMCEKWIYVLWVVHWQSNTWCSNLKQGRKTRRQSCTARFYYLVASTINVTYLFMTCFSPPVSRVLQGSQCKLFTYLRVTTSSHERGSDVIVVTLKFPPPKFSLRNLNLVLKCGFTYVMYRLSRITNVVETTLNQSLNQSIS